MCKALLEIGLVMRHVCHLCNCEGAQRTTYIYGTTSSVWMTEQNFPESTRSVSRLLALIQILLAISIHSGDILPNY